MGMKDFTINAIDIPFEVGDVIKVDGKRYKVATKTATAVALTRHYWFDALWDRIK